MSNARRGTIPLAIGIFALNLQAIAWAVLVLIFLEGLTTILFGAAPRLPLNFIFTALVLHAALRTITSNGQVTGFDATLTSDGSLPWGFLLRTLILTVPGALASLMVAGLILPGGGMEPALLGGMIGGVSTNSLVYALFGTMLLDIAQGRDGDPEQALDEGRARFPAGVWLILTGPGLAEFCLFAFEMAARLLGLATRVAEAGAEHLNPDGIVVDALLYAGGAFISITMAAALVRLRQMTV
ncbi:MAG: hypothetical protein AAF899_10900 [Pseudomonadota bacterium]